MDDERHNEQNDSFYAIMLRNHYHWDKCHSCLGLILFLLLIYYCVTL